jgi:hypothetical protein
VRIHGFTISTAVQGQRDLNCRDCSRIWARSDRRAPSIVPAAVPGAHSVMRCGASLEPLRACSRYRTLPALGYNIRR